MKLNMIIKVLLSAIMMVMITSCSESITSEGPEVPPEVDEQLDALKDICLNWGESKTSVSVSMEKYSKVDEDDETMIFANEDASTLLAYQFSNNQLMSALVAFNQLKENIVATKLPAFSYFGRLSDCALYSNEESNTMCSYYTTTFDDSDYSVVGFTPIESSLFGKLEPISVAIDEVSSITESGALVRCSVTGDYASAKVGVMVSSDEDFDDAKSYTATIKNGSFSATISKLTHDTKYWCYAYITIDGITYKSTPMTFETAHMDTYEVGDLYPKDGTPQGVVFYVDATGTHGKIVSFAQEYCKWENVDLFGEGYMGNYNNTSDGEKAKLPKNSSLNDFIKSLGEGWYCPAKGELSTLSKVVDIVNSTLERNGYKELGAFYYSCNEINKAPNGICVYCVTVCGSSGFMGYSNGYTFYVSKSNSEYARGIKKF